MDASEIIKRLKEKTIFYNIQAQFSTSLAKSNANMRLTINNLYNFDNYEDRENYFNGKCDVSTCTAVCYQ